MQQPKHPKSPQLLWTAAPIRGQPQSSAPNRAKTYIYSNRVTHEPLIPARISKTARFLEIPRKRPFTELFWQSRVRGVFSLAGSTVRSAWLLSANGALLLSLVTPP